jgi:hypothetical protein
MDEIDLLRHLRSEVPQASPAGLLRARAGLLRELEGSRTAPARPARLPVGRTARRMAAGFGLAVALTAAVFAAQSVRAPQAPAREPARILRNAALAAEHAQLLPARPDQYVLIESITAYHGERFSCDGKADQSHCKAIPDPTVRKLRQIWLSADGTRDGLLRERPQASNARWSETPLEACPKGVHAVGPDRKAVTAPCVPQPAYHADLPTNAGAMLRYLQQHAQAHDAKDRGDHYAFTVADDLIREAYLSPASLAALFEAMTRLPGLTVAQDAVDAAGRHGISVGADAGGVRNELIFDAATYAYLGERTIALQDVDGLKQGAIAGQSARLRLAIVDRPGQLP